MVKRFAKRSPRAASVLIYVAGYLAGSVFGVLLVYLISGFWKMNAAVPFGAGCGALALRLAQNQGLVPEPEELNRPISLFGSGGFHGEGRK